MRGLYFLLTLVSFTSALDKGKCVCPQVKCPGEQPAVSAHRFHLAYASVTHVEAAMQLP